MRAMFGVCRKQARAKSEFSSFFLQPVNIACTIFARLGIFARVRLYSSLMMGNRRF